MQAKFLHSGVVRIPTYRNNGVVILTEDDNENQICYIRYAFLLNE